jgi:8-amino-7-oxononanoate synthase
MADDLAELHERGLYRERRRPQSAQGVRVRLRGRELLNFSSNDYLNLAADPGLAQAAARAAQRHGCGTGSSPLVSGHLAPHRALERDLARWEGTEAALVFSSGFAANLALVSSLASKETAIYSDELNHASLIDGCRLARATVHVYRHGDMAHLEDLLRRTADGFDRRLIVSDSVFSMDGDLAPLPELAALAQRYEALLLLDEAHATGVLGEHGRGLSELCPPGAGFEPARLIKMGTLSKALGTQGGFVCGPRLLCDWLVNRARPYIFSTALAPPVVAAARCALGIVEAEPQRRRHLLGLATLLRDEVRAIGHSTAPSPCQIVPVVVGSAQAAVALSERLQKRGLLVPAIRPPSVPEGSARLRISLTAGHTEKDVRCLVQALKELRAVGVIA